MERNSERKIEKERRSNIKALMHAINCPLHVTRTQGLKRRGHGALGVEPFTSIGWRALLSE